MKTLLTMALRFGLKPLLVPSLPLAVQRFAIGAATLPLRRARGIAIESTALGGRPALRLRPKGSSPNPNPSPNPTPRILYLHGGGYVVGGFASHRKLCSQLSAHTGSEVWLLDYRLAPEHPHPAAVDDAVAAARALAAQSAAPIVIAGDSAGGGLALATAMALPNQGTPEVAGLVLLSPWVDLTLSGESIRSLAGADAMLSLPWVEFCAQAYAGGSATGRSAQGCSPLFASEERLRALPPVLIQVGDQEMLLSDAQRMAERLRAAGVSCDLQITADVGHVFQVFAGWVPEADAALQRVGIFVKAAAHRG